MNQLFYNIAGGILHQIRREKRTTISKVIVRGKRFYFKFSVERSNLKRKNLSLSLKAETDQFVICSFLPDCFFNKLCCTSTSDSEANREGVYAESHFPLFFSFSASFKNSSPREKVGKLSSSWDCGPSLCLYPLLPSSCVKKFLAMRFARAISLHYRDFECAYVY